MELGLSCCSFEVQYAGLIPDISSDIDPTGRTDILRVIDQGKRDGQIRRPPKEIVADSVLRINSDAIRLFSMVEEEEGEVELLLQAPIHMVSTVGLLKEEGVNLLTVRIGHVSSNRDASDLVVLYAPSQEVAMALCKKLESTFGQLFIETTQALVTESPGWNQTEEHNLHASTNAMTAPPLPHPRCTHQQHGGSSGAGSTLRSASTATSGRSTSAAEVLQEYMRMLTVHLTPNEMTKFADLLKKWTSNGRTFSEFLQKKLELLGPERKYLLPRMRPFVPEADLPYFDSFLELSGISNNAESSIPSCSPACDSIYSMTPGPAVQQCGKELLDEEEINRIRLANTAHPSAQMEVRPPPPRRWRSPQTLSVTLRTTSPPTPTVVYQEKL